MTPANMTRFGLFAITLLLFVSACAGPRAADRSEPADDLPEPVDVRLSDYEHFDVEPYREARPTEEVIEHDVPAVLMDGRAGASGDTRVAQGFRIQIVSSVEKDEAVAAEEEARLWWRSERGSAPRGLLPAELPTYVVYRQPYYRLRIGDFASRSEAQQALSVVESRYPGAFIVPDTVTLRN